MASPCKKTNLFYDHSISLSSLSSSSRATSRLERLTTSIFLYFLHHLTIEEFISLGLLNKSFVQMTNLHFPNYASCLFLRHRVLTLHDESSSDNMADIIRTCRLYLNPTQDYSDVILHDAPHPAPSEDNSWISRYTWTCGGVNNCLGYSDFDNISSELRGSMRTAYKPIDDFEDSTNSYYCSKRGSLFMDTGRGFLYKFAFMAMQFRSPMVEDIVTRMEFDERISFQIDAYLFHGQFEDALQCALRIDGRKHGLTKYGRISYVIQKLGKDRQKLLKALLVIILHADRGLTFKSEGRVPSDDVSESVLMMQNILMKVWQEDGLPKAIEFAHFIPFMEWRCEAITHLVARLAFGPAEGIRTYYFTTAWNYTIESNIESAVHLFRNSPPDSVMQEDRRKSVQAMRALYIMDALLDCKKQEQAKEFLPFLKAKKTSNGREYVIAEGLFSHHKYSYFYPKVKQFYYENS